MKSIILIILTSSYTFALTSAVPTDLSAKSDDVASVGAGTAEEKIDKLVSLLETLSADDVGGKSEGSIAPMSKLGAAVKAAEGSEGETNVDFVRTMGSKSVPADFSSKSEKIHLETASVRKQKMDRMISLLRNIGINMQDRNVDGSDTPSLRIGASVNAAQLTYDDFVKEMGVKSADASTQHMEKMRDGEQLDKFVAMYFGIPAPSPTNNLDGKIQEMKSYQETLVKTPSRH